MLRLNTRRHAVVFETWQKINLSIRRKVKKNAGLPMPLSLLVEPLELASDAVQNIPSEIKTKTLQQKIINGKVKVNSDNRKSIVGPKQGQLNWAKSQVL